jgi:hypothetical protein
MERRVFEPRRGHAVKVGDFFGDFLWRVGQDPGRFIGDFYCARGSRFAVIF